MNRNQLYLRTAMLGLAGVIASIELMGQTENSNNDDVRIIGNVGGLISLGLISLKTFTDINTISNMPNNRVQPVMNFPPIQQQVNLQLPPRAPIAPEAPYI